ncbi:MULTISPECIES: heme-copper oxidase subunit III [Acidithrix]|uniref:cytochrome-c oxidase n=1 Tax=Acidithrix ferrooxidans TaxID=1280514 RepID=A0A0D8HJH7_9ACTN|nr:MULTISPECIES: heme-copper oxidase subunit III [Acidithrix]KJF18014.1 cytochrome c oxidase subunit 3 [Acidithrix ferrooxidans]CAG4918378.1 unnamed protein product [Acidithrix sp. C25]
MSQTIATRSGAESEPIRFNRPSMLGIGTMVWLSSELMFFSGLFAAYFTLRSNATGPWPPGGIKLDVIQSGIFTIILVMSSVTMQKAVFEAEHGRRKSAIWWIVLTITMGGSFVANQVVEWTHVAFSASTNSFGSLFFVMTGLHGLHVILGLVAMIFLIGRLAGRTDDPGALPVIQSLSYYWHFVDIVWIALYAVLFLTH